MDYAQSVFPQLAQLPRERIAFTVNVRVGGTPRSVRVAPMAWSRVVGSLATYEIVDLCILPQAIPNISRAAKSDTDVRSTFTSGVDDGSTSAHASSSFLRQGGGGLTDGDESSPPPRYGGAPGLRIDSENFNYNRNLLVDVDGPETEKSSSNSLLAPPSPQPFTRRCASALGWLGNKNSQ